MSPSPELLCRLLDLLRSGVGFADTQMRGAEREREQRGPVGLAEHRQFTAAAEALNRLRISLAFAETAVRQLQWDDRVNGRSAMMAEITDKAEFLGQRLQSARCPPLLSWPNWIASACVCWSHSTSSAAGWILLCGTGLGGSTGSRGQGNGKSDVRCLQERNAAAVLCARCS